MSLQNTPGYGSTIAYAGTDYSSPTTIGNLIDINVPEDEVDPVQNSNFGTSGHTHTYQAGWVKPGKLQVTINFDHTIVATLEGFLGTMKGWIITLNDGTAIGGTTASTIKLNGFISKKGSKIPMDKLVTYTFDVQQSGPTTVTAGT